MEAETASNNVASDANGSVTNLDGSDADIEVS